MGSDDGSHHGTLLASGRTADVCLLDGHVPVGDAATMLANLHRDLHPDNVVLTASGPVVVDWSNDAHGPADHDVAMSALILAQVAMMRPAELDRLEDAVTLVGTSSRTKTDWVQDRRRT